MKSSKRFVLTLVATAACFVLSVAAHAITITSNNVYASVNSSDGSADGHFYGTSIPTSLLIDATAGEFYSRMQIDYFGSGNQVTLLTTFDQKRSGDVYHAFADGNDATMYFTADANTTYSLSGAYSSTGVSSAGQVYFSSNLYDQTAGSYNFYNYQSSVYTLNENFVLGGVDGDIYNGLSGSLTGSLIAGHSYEWIYEAVTTRNYDHTDGGATATGFLRLDIGGGATSSVPDGGGTLAMIGMALTGLAALRRKYSAA